MMTQRFLPLFSVFAIAAVLWVVPSIVSQGMVTVGERFRHADEGLLDGAGTTAENRNALRGADARVETAVASAHLSEFAYAPSLANGGNASVRALRVD